MNFFNFLYCYLYFYLFRSNRLGKYSFDHRNNIEHSYKSSRDNRSTTHTTNKLQSHTSMKSREVLNISIRSYSSTDANLLSMDDTIMDPSHGSISDRNNKYKYSSNVIPYTPRKRLIARCNGYWIEEGTCRDQITQLKPDDLTIKLEPEDLNGEIPFGFWFHKYFTKGSYQSFLSNSGPDGHVIVLLKKEKFEKVSNYRVLYVSTERTIGLIARPSQLRGKIGKGIVFKKILYLIDPLLSCSTFQKCDDDIHKALDELELLETCHTLTQDQFKFGILNWREENKNEEDMFSNKRISKVSIHNTLNLQISTKYLFFENIIFNL